MTVAGKRCLVLGGGGFIGAHLCRHLVEAGADVAAFGHLPRYAPPSVQWHEAEFADVPALRRALAGRQRLFHLLGGSIPAQSNADPVGDVEASLVPTLRLIDACRAAGVERLIFASSGGTVYGVTDAAPVREDAPTDPITAYGVNKLLVEKYLGLYRHLYGFDSVVLRISNPYGPMQTGHRDQGVVGALIRRALSGDAIEIWGEGDILRDFIHVDDVVRAMVEAAEYDGRFRLFNVGSGVGRSVRSVAEAVVRATGADPGSIRYLSGRAADVPTNILDVARIGRELGWTPRIGWEKGLADTVAWARAALNP